MNADTRSNVYSGCMQRAPAALTALMHRHHLDMRYSLPMHRGNDATRHAPTFHLQSQKAEHVITPPTQRFMMESDQSLTVLRYSSGCCSSLLSSLRVALSLLPNNSNSRRLRSRLSSFSLRPEAAPAPALSSSLPSFASLAAALLAICFCRVFSKAMVARPRRSWCAFCTVSGAMCFTAL